MRKQTPNRNKTRDAVRKAIQHAGHVQVTLERQGLELTAGIDTLSFYCDLSYTDDPWIDAIAWSDPATHASMTSAFLEQTAKTSWEDIRNFFKKTGDSSFYYDDIKKITHRRRVIYVRPE